MSKPLTKKDIKDVFVKSLEPFAKAVQGDFLKVNNRLDGVENRLGGVEKEIRTMKENSNELFTKIDKFITLYETQRQELSILGAQLNRLEERVIKLENKN